MYKLCKKIRNKNVEKNTKNNKRLTRLSQESIKTGKHEAKLKSRKEHAQNKK